MICKLCGWADWVCRFADSDQSEDEGILDYKIGGYHPLHVGEIMVERYLIV
jgi:serine/threonine-protein kinase SRPK3